MKQNNTQPLKIDFNKNVLAIKEIISRRNQDGTVILMKLDDNNMFYKLNGISAALWACMQSPCSAADLANAVAKMFPEVNRPDLEKDTISFVNTLAINKLVQETAEPTLAPVSTVFQDAVKSLNMSSYDFGQIKEFNLEQIEKEVLNDSIYLDVFAGSDLRLKTDVKPLTQSLQKLSQLEGIQYLWNQTAVAQGAPEGKVQTGVIAQQVLEQWSDLVTQDKSTGFLAVNYTKLVPHLIEAIKELKSIIDAQAVELTEIKNKLNQLKH